jgi:hypothetical protein
MQKLLKRNIGRICFFQSNQKVSVNKLSQNFYIRLFILGNFLSIEIRKKSDVQFGKRIDIIYDIKNVENLIKSEIKNRKDRIMIFYKFY